jgi:hypothetical protein
MDIIQLVIVIVLFACVVWGLDWAIVKYELPKPVRWVVGGLIVVILLLFLLRVTGVWNLNLNAPILR